MLLTQNREWVISISRTLEEALYEKNDDEGVLVSIFNVPKTLMSSKPEAYTPQMVALGPYHRLQPELTEMERYKLTSAKRVQRRFGGKTKLSDVVRRFEENDCRIRGYYHRFLEELDRETLAWILALDASFLLEYLHTYSVCRRRRECLDGDSRLTGVWTSKMAHLIDYTRRKTAQHAILRDIVMLENQIPLFLIRELFAFIHFNNNDHDDHDDRDHKNHDEVLAKMLFGFCQDLSPFKFVDIQNLKAEQESCLLGKSHLLALLYSVVVPKTLLPSEEIIEQNKAKDDDDKENDDDDGNNKNDTNIIHGNMNNWVVQALKTFLIMLTFVLSAPILLLEKIHKSKTIMFILTLPYKVTVHFFCLKGKTSAVNNFVTSADNLAEEIERIFLEAPSDDSPLIEEISIPSVSELSKIGVKFTPASTGGLTAIKFDKACGKFHLPVVHLDDNSEVVLRNLVAYEVSAVVAEEAVAFTRYTELMNGIIDTEEDARVLREAGVVVNRLKSDKEVAALWNGMTRSVRMTRVRVLDKAIEEVNKYYWGSWRVRVKVAMKKYVFGSWPILAFLAANVLLLLSALEAGCSVYNCSKWFHSDQN